MDSWQDSLHWSLQGAHVLLPALRLDSFAGFVAGSLLSVGICLTERLVTFASEHKWTPHFVGHGHGRVRYALWRAGLYWVVTLLRLLYMLIAMSFHVGLILVTVTTLATAQFIIEYQQPPDNYQPLDKESEAYSLDEPLLSEASSEAAQVVMRPRSRSKPQNIFIHPKHSNLARADAAVLQLNIGGAAERQTYAKEDAAWEAGKGKEGARALMGHSRREAQRQPAPSYRVGSDSDSDA